MYLYQSFTFCLGPLSSFLRLMPITLVTPLNRVAILVRPLIQSSGSKYWSPKNPLPSELPQHQPGFVMWLSNITMTLLSPRLDTTAWKYANNNVSLYKYKCLTIKVKKRKIYENFVEVAYISIVNVDTLLALCFCFWIMFHWFVKWLIRHHWLFLHGPFPYCVDL